MDASVPGSHRRALAARRLVQAGPGAPGMEAERAELGLGPHDEAPRVVPETDWARLVHKSGLDREVKVERDVHDSRGSYVAKCRLLSSGQPVALKILSPALWDSLDVEERFRREGQILRELSHPNVVRLVRSGVYGYARWLMLEWIEGPDLRSALADGPLDVVTAMDLGIGLTAGLAELHRHAMVHRDVKPENILWDKSANRAVLADFGIAKLGRSFADDLTLTFTEDVLGTIGYIPPEALRGSKYVDARVDIYAAGVALLELTSGELPPQDREPAWSPPPVHRAIDPIIEKATAFEPADRYASADEMRAALVAARPRGLFRRLFGRR